MSLLDTNVSIQVLQATFHPSHRLSSLKINIDLVIRSIEHFCTFVFVSLMFCNKCSRNHRRGVFAIIVLFLIGTLIHQNYFSTVLVRFPISVQQTNTNSSFNLEWKKAKIAHYTALYGHRMDASSNVFDDHFKQICEIIEPEKYMFADAVIASIVDLTDLPRLSNGSSYREVHSSQFWLFYAEESPRNSYHRKNIVDLDAWFDFSATLRSESDFPIQYRVC